MPESRWRTAICWGFTGRLTYSFFLKDRCALADQMSFVQTFPWRGFFLAMRDRDRANKNEIAVIVFSVTSNDFPHDMLLCFGLSCSQRIALCASFPNFVFKFVTVSSLGIFPTGIAPTACLLAGRTPGRAVVTDLVRQLQFSVLSMGVLRANFSVLPLDRTAHRRDLLVRPVACFSDLPHCFE
jgi:hypothetical protein